MADKKISDLPASTTPLAGTEVLPIVQSSTTKQVSVANLTAGRTQTSNGIVQGTAATGYNFTANTPAAGMTSQLLNWYEEGTWTPVLGGTGGATGQVYSVQSGRYTRVGRMMTCTMSCTLSTLGTITGGNRITGLPVASSSTSPQGSVTITYSANLGVPVVSIGGRVEGSDTTCLIVYRVLAATDTSFDSTAMWTATTSLNATIVYFI